MGSKATIYVTYTAVKYVGNPPATRETTIYKYLSNNQVIYDLYLVLCAYIGM
jgi:hypothetical protein